MLKVITFGDSLTVGYQSPSIDNPWYTETPYGDFLAELSGNRLDVTTMGISGEMTEEMLERFDRDVIADRPDYVIILGGTNDIGWGLTPDAVIENLTGMYRMAIADNIKPVSMTIPSIRGFDDIIHPRIILNDMIKDRSASLKIGCIDYFTASSEPQTLRLAAKYSNDGLHLSTAGYRLMAELVYEGVFKRLPEI